MPQGTANRIAAPPSSSNRERVNPVKTQQILIAARRLFMDQGFGATSMEAIAREAGVGKATLYANFATKQALFGAVVSGETMIRGDALLAEAASTRNLVDTLTRFAESFVELLLSPTNVAMYRIIAAEAPRLPELGRIFYESGPAQIIARLGGYMQAAMAAGELRAGPPEIAAAQFIGLVRADLQMRAMLGVAPAPGPDILHEVVQSGVGVFLRAYAPG